MRLRVTREEARRAFGNPEIYVEKFLLPPAPRRDPGACRQPRQRALAGQPRLLAAAPPPEGAGGGAGARHRPGLTRRGRRALRAGLPADRLPRRRHLRVPVRGRRLLLHRDEHAAAGRASGHRDDRRHRHRRSCRSAWRAASGCHSRRPTSPAAGTRSNAGINAEDPETFAPSPGLITRLADARRPRRARRQPRRRRLPRAALLRLASSAS